MRAVQECINIGITPAYAGSIAQTLQGLPRSWDHPRIRGEHKVAQVSPRPVVGSPPHTRGAFEGVSVAELTGGITPAYAGSILRLCRFVNVVEDHPRIRGEHLLRLTGSQCAMGSPPHTRGALRMSPASGSETGITPAYAGSICWVFWRWQPPQDHPRIRGEHRL